MTSDYVENAKEEDVLCYLAGKLKVFKSSVSKRKGIWKNPEVALGWAEQFLEAVEKIRTRMRLSGALLEEIVNVLIFARQVREELKEKYS